MFDDKTHLFLMVLEPQFIGNLIAKNRTLIGFVRALLEPRFSMVL